MFNCPLSFGALVLGHLTNCRRIILFACRSGCILSPIHEIHFLPVSYVHLLEEQQNFACVEYHPIKRREMCEVLLKLLEYRGGVSSLPRELDLVH